MPLLALVATVLSAQAVVTSLARLPNPTPLTGERFGFGVALDGNTAIVGATGVFVGSSDYAGEASVLRFDGSSWNVEATLTDPTPIEPGFFGGAVAVQGDQAFIACEADSHSTLGVRVGSVHVFSRNGSSWTHSALLEPSDAALGIHNFGRAVAVDGNTLVVTAPPWGAYVFERSGSSWIERAKLVSSGQPSSASDFFGSDVELDGERIVVSDIAHSLGAYTSVGAIYVFARSGTSWVQEAKLQPNDPSNRMRLGWSVDLRGERLAAGAINAPNNQSIGAVYVFERVNGVWSQSQKLTASDGTAPDHFGDSLALAGDRLYIGAYGDDVGPGLYSGSLYTFELAQPGWVELNKYSLPAPIAFSEFSRGLAYSPGRLLVGARSESEGAYNGAGAAYVLQLDIAHDTYCTSAITSLGCEPRIEAAGSPSASLATPFSMRIEQVNGVSNGLFFYGLSGRVSSPWGPSGSAGTLCVKAPTQRTPLRSSGGAFGSCNGVLQLDWNAFVATHPGSLGQPFAAGDVVQAQGWFRDPPSTKHTALSNALEFLVQL